MKNHDFRHSIISSRKIRFWWNIMFFDILSDHREESDFDEKSWFSTFYHIIAENKILMKSHDFRYFVRSSGRMRFWWKNHDVRPFIISSREIRFWWKIMIFNIRSDHRGEWDFDEKSWFSTFDHTIAENKILMENYNFRYLIRSSGRMRFWWKIMIFDILSYHRGK